jgi:hypothetical protein
MSQTVVFSGRIRKGSSREEVRNNFSRIFKLSNQKQLDRFFSGEPVVIRQGLSADEARRYEQFLFKAGALCEIHPADSNGKPQENRNAAALASPRPASARAPTRPRQDSGQTAAVNAEPVALAHRPGLRLWPLLVAALVIMVSIEAYEFWITLHRVSESRAVAGMNSRQAGQNPVSDPEKHAQMERAKAQIELSRKASSPVPGPERDAARQQMISQAKTDQQRQALQKLYQIIDQNHKPQ